MPRPVIAKTTPKKRKPRSKITVFDEADLVARLKPFAKMKESSLGFKWDCTDCPKPTRSNGADIEHLARCSPVLYEIAVSGRNGYPQHKGLRRVLEQLDKASEAETVQPEGLASGPVPVMIALVAVASMLLHTSTSAV